MEIDIIEGLVKQQPAWMSAFPVVVCVEYSIDIQPHPTSGKGDLLLSNPDFTHYLVVEVKRHSRSNRKLLHQMNRYRDAVKSTCEPHIKVDGAAVAAGKLVCYVRDERFRPYKHRRRPSQPRCLFHRYYPHRVDTTSRLNPAWVRCSR